MREDIDTADGGSIMVEHEYGKFGLGVAHAGEAAYVRLTLAELRALATLLERIAK